MVIRAELSLEFKFERIIFSQFTTILLVSLLADWLLAQSLEKKGSEFDLPK